jgi:hypothetical protein
MPGTKASEATPFFERLCPGMTVTLHEQAAVALYERKLVLVRRDGHVAWRGNDMRDADAVVDSVRGG